MLSGGQCTGMLFSLISNVLLRTPLQRLGREVPSIVMDETDTSAQGPPAQTVPHISEERQSRCILGIGLSEDLRGSVTVAETPCSQSSYSMTGAQSQCRGASSIA